MNTQQYIALAILSIIGGLMSLGELSTHWDDWKDKLGKFAIGFFLFGLGAWSLWALFS